MSEYIVYESESVEVTDYLGGTHRVCHHEKREEIVRCWDCKYYQDHNFGSKLDWCRYFHYDVHLDGFCKWGERVVE